MKRKFVDINLYESRNMVQDGNVDYKFWFNKSIEERLAAAIVMIEFAFQTSDFTKQKVDRTIFAASKRN